MPAPPPIPEADLLKRITIDPNQCSGEPCIRGMRIRVIDILDLLAAGLTPAQVVDDLEDIDEADVRAALVYAARRLKHPLLVA